MGRFSGPDGDVMVPLVIWACVALGIVALLLATR